MSSDPNISFTLVSNGDTTGCTFDISVDWGGNAGTTSEPPIQGAGNGTRFGPYKHDYKEPGGYQIVWTSTLVSNTGFNNCASSTDKLSFTLVTAGIYADFQSTTLVRQAVAAHWTMLANVAGVGKPSGCSSPWTAPTNHDSDSNVEQVLAGLAAAGQTPPAWISYWTPDVPPTGTALEAAGRDAGAAAALDIEKAADRSATPVAPLYVALDFEESMPASGVISCGSPVSPTAKNPGKGKKQCWQWQGTASKQNCVQLSLSGWKAFADGWAAGIRAAAFPVTLVPAVYVTQGQYRGSGLAKYGYPKYAVGTWGLPVIVAVDPVTTKAPVTGPGIAGYAAFGDWNTPATCATAPGGIKNVVTWGGVSTIQFGHRLSPKPKYSNSDYCTPAGKAF